VESTDRPVLRSRVGLIAGIGLAVLLCTLMSVGATPPTTALATVLVTAATIVTVLAWALVRSRQHRRAYEDDLTVWAGERAAQAERLRIARELHDLASHGLGLITVRAASARTLPGPYGDTERTSALADIERVSREATTELRRMLTVLRTPGDETAPLRPAETLDDLPQIVESAHSSGVIATLTAEDLLDVSAGAQVTICAIVREALANTARHAGPTRARVTVARVHGVVAVAVEDDGPVADWNPLPGTGQGLAGLRERLTALGGTLRAQPGERGFRLTAHLPDRERR
jgi:two-component system sensor histidine kinase DesK